MISRVNSLSLRPIDMQSGKIPSETSVTSFEEILRRQKKNQRLATSTEQVASGQADTAVQAAERTNKKAAQNTAEQTSGGTEEENSGSAAAVTYRNPVTGASVHYVDVAKKEDGEAQETSAAGNVSTTSASSMKKTKYDSYFKKAALKYNVSESLLKAIAKAESNFNAGAVSSAGAIGVMQLMPATAEGLGVSNPYDPEQNIMGGAKCISQKLKEFKGDVKLALAAYNAGSGAVKRYGGVPSYCNTYVKRVLSYKEAFETASAVG